MASIQIGQVARYYYDEKKYTLFFPEGSFELEGFEGVIKKNRVYNEQQLLSDLRSSGCDVVVKNTGEYFVTRETGQAEKKLKAVLLFNEGDGTRQFSWEARPGWNFDKNSKLTCQSMSIIMKGVN